MRRLALCALLLAACDAPKPVTAPVFEPVATVPDCDVEFAILGTGQDAGAPQIGVADDPAWKDPDSAMWATSAAILDHRSSQTWLIEATPDIKAQLNLLDSMTPDGSGVDAGPLDLEGVFLTHAHIGHYGGLMMLGREAAATDDIPVHTLPRMGRFLRENGPWSQLVELGNIRLVPTEFDRPVILSGGISVTAIPVTHRDEFSETVALRVETSEQSALFLPDIDNWDDLDILAEVDRVDHAFLDATFFSDTELPGRDMSVIPHPRVRDTMEALPGRGSKVRFIHLNHTNPLRDRTSPEAEVVARAGFGVARRGERYCLVE